MLHSRLAMTPLAVFLRLGFFIGEDTPFAGVKQLAPGSVLRWDAERGVRVEDGGLLVWAVWHLLAIRGSCLDMSSDLTTAATQRKHHAVR